MGFFRWPIRRLSRGHEGTARLAQWQQSLVTSGFAMGPEIDLPVTGIADHPHVINVAAQVHQWQALTRRRFRPRRCADEAAA